MKPEIFKVVQEKTEEMLNRIEDKLKLKTEGVERKGIIEVTSENVCKMWLKELKGNLCHVFDGKRTEIWNVSLK